MKKKFLSAILSAVLASALALTLTACGEDKEAPSKENSQGEVSVSDSKPDDAAAASSADPDISSESISSGDTSSSDESSESVESSESIESSESSKPNKPQTVDSRRYKRRPIDEYDNEDMYIVVEILDNGGWYLSSDTWAGQTYASYSFEEEAAGAYVTVIGYGGGPEPTYVGEVRFTMTEELLTVQYEDDDSYTYYDRYD